MHERLNVLSTHIEKNAGSSGAKFIGTELFPPERMYIFKPRTMDFIRYDEVMQEKGSSAKRSIKHLLILSGLFPYIKYFIPIPKDPYTHYSAEYVFSLPSAAKHGHFRADQFDHMLSTPHVTMVLVRHPKQRMESWYRYLRASHGPVNQRIPIEITPWMTFPKFALHPELANWQTNALGSKTLRDFDFVGVTERMPEALAQLRRMFHLPDKPATETPHVNRSVYYARSVRMSPVVEEEFRSLHAADYRLYEEANRLVDRYSRQ